MKDGPKMGREPSSGHSISGLHPDSTTNIRVKVSASGSEEAICEMFWEKKAGRRLLWPTTTLILTSRTDGRRGNRMISTSVQKGTMNPDITQRTFRIDGKVLQSYGTRRHDSLNVAGAVLVDMYLQTLDLLGVCGLP
jgi:hypothetical protein